MSKVNQVRLIGNVGQKPTVVNLPDGKVIVNFTMATTENYKLPNGQKEQKTEWHKIIAFGKITPVIQQYVEKGTKLMVEGKLQTRQYVDKDGVNRYTTEIVLEEVLFLSPKAVDQAPQ
jgi:single-strand DNA-binding protein